MFLLKKVNWMAFYFLFILNFSFVNAAFNCTAQSDCSSIGPNSNCVFLTAATSNSPPQGICSEPTSKTISFSTANPTATPIPDANNSSCGTSAISSQCAFGQFCVMGSCTNLGDAAKSFFTPTMIAVFVIAGVVLCFGFVCFCFLCKCCCFSGRIAGRSAKKIVAAPFRKQSEIQQQQRQQPLSTVSYGPSIHPSHMKDASIISIQQKQSSSPAPLPNSGHHSVSLFHTEEKIEYIPAILPQIIPFEKDDPFEYVPYEQYERHQPEPNQYLAMSTPFHGQQGSSYKQEPPSKNDSKQVVDINALSNRFPYQDSPDSQNTTRFLQNPILNQTVVKMIGNSNTNPPLGAGFWAFWDKQGQFHQGYTDSNGIIYGGVFDDLCYFHFGSIGDREPILVDDSMLSGRYQSENGGIKIIAQDNPASSKNSLNGTRANNDVAQRSNFLAIPQDFSRERGESMDVLGAVSNNE